MPTNPFDQFDNSTNPFNQFDAPAAKAGSTSTFKSGSAFEDTLNLLKSIPDAWDKVKKEWGNDESLSDLQARYKKASPTEKAAIEDKLTQNVKGAHAAGSALADLAGAAPAMAVGGVAGVGSALWNTDASKGLKTGGEVMNKLMPSTLTGHEDDQKQGTYQAVMAPFTGLMDTMNAIPQGYGEMLNATGHTDAAGQVTDAGKLAIMAAMGVEGAHSAYKGIMSKKGGDLRIEDPRKEPTLKANPFDQFDKQNSAADRGTPGQAPGDQGSLFSPEGPATQPMGEAGQGDLFGGMPPVLGDPTMAHADDFAAVNPYDMGGHVTASDQGHPTTIDNPQGELFGGQSMEQPPATPISPNSMLHTRAEPPAPIQAELTGLEPTPPNAMTNAMRDAQTDLTFRQRDTEAAAKKQADTDAAYASSEAAKQADYAKMEAQRELDHMNTANDVASTPGRNFFTDPANRDKLDLHDVTGDHGYAGDGLGDKSLMEPEHTQTMVDALRRGDVKGALQVIMNVHNDVAYRKLAEYLHGALDNINIKVHDEGILQIGDRQATGYFDPESRTVGLSRVGAVSPHTVLHELVHAMTSDFVNTRPNDMRVLGLKDLYNKLNDLGMQREFPGITNVKEFLAESFSNPEFQKYLQEHQIQSRSTWRRFVDNVKSLLGISSSARNAITNALEHVMDLGKQVMDAKTDGATPLKDAGVPGKLADLMVTRQPERPNQVVRNEGMEKLTGLGKLKAQFDFTPLKPEDIIKMAKEATDIPKGALETIKANLDAGGRMASLRHGNNPVVKYTFAHIDQAVKNYENWIKTNITDPKTGAKPLLRSLPEDDFASVHNQIMLDEGHLERTPQQMRALGWDQKMIDAAQRIRQLDKEVLGMVNEARAQMNPPLPPIERRIGHLAGRFLGDFYHTVYELKRDKFTGKLVLDEYGKPIRDKAVMMVTGSTRWEARRIAKFVQENHPEWYVEKKQGNRVADQMDPTKDFKGNDINPLEVSKQEYKGVRKGNNSDRFSGFMELMSFIGDKDPEIAKALDTLDKYNRNAATNYLNAQRHAKAKKQQAGGILGSEGNKLYDTDWKGNVVRMSAVKNAEQGFKGQLAYLDTSVKWVEMQKAMANISKVITDKDVAMQMPNAVKWSTAYTDHALHRNQGWMTDFAQSFMSEAGRWTGVGHTNITKGINTMSTYEMRKWMGIGNIPFALKHMLLPFQKMPAMMAYMHTVGGLTPARQAMAGLKSLGSYTRYLDLPPKMRGALDSVGLQSLSSRIKDNAITPFEEQAFRYARDNNVMNVNLDNLSGRIQAGKTRQVLGKLADIDFSAPEHAIRGNSFFFYAHLLHDAGMEPQSALSAAEHLTKFLYTDYAPHEAPRAAAKAGWLGQLAFQVTRYKMNEISQLGFFSREGLDGMTDADHSYMKKLTSNAPLMTHIASTLAFTGVVGMLGYNEADHLYSLFRKYVMGSPDNLMAALQRSNAPESVKYGLFSRIGIDPKIDESHLILAPFPTTTSQIEGIGKAWDMARYHDAWHTKQFLLSQTPSTFRGLAENHMFTQPQETQGPHAGKSLYLNPNTGEGRVWRTPEQQTLRNYGFHSTAETNETNNSYAISRIESDNRDLAEHAMTKAKGLVASGSATPEALQGLAREYAQHVQAGQPEFSAELQSYIMKQHMSQREQMEYKAANDRGMANSLNIMQRNK